MHKLEIKTTLDELSKNLFSVSKELGLMKSNLELKMDKKAMIEINTDILAVEKLTVIGLHQIEKTLDDNNGNWVTLLNQLNVKTTYDCCLRILQFY